MKMGENSKRRHVERKTNQGRGNAKWCTDGENVEERKLACKKGGKSNEYRLQIRRTIITNEERHLKYGENGKKNAQRPK